MVIHPTLLSRKQKKFRSCRALLVFLKQTTSLQSAHVAIMLRVAFVLPITYYQTNQQLETEFTTSRKKHLRLEERNISVNTTKFKSTKHIIIVYSFWKQEKSHSFDHKDAHAMQNALVRRKYKVNQYAFLS